MSQKKSSLLFVLFLSKLCFPAFENTFKYQYLDFKYGQQLHLSHITPYGMPALAQSQFHFNYKINSFPFHTFLSTAGDNLYRESVFELKFSTSIGRGFRLGPIIQGYSVLIKNYPDLYASSTGIYLTRSDSTFQYSIELKNLFITDRLKNDLPQIFRFDVVYYLEKHQFQVALFKDMLYPPELNFIWEYAIFANSKIKMGMMSGTTEILCGTVFQVKKLTPELFFLLHPQLGITYGVSLAFK
jgi:hypothetical protein